MSETAQPAGLWRRPKYARSAHFFPHDAAMCACGAWWRGAVYAVTLPTDRRCVLCSRATVRS